MTDLIAPQLLALLRCPVSGKPLRISGDKLVTDDGHAYDVVHGIPRMVPADMEHTHNGYGPLMEDVDESMSVNIDTWLDTMIVPTCGNLFRGVKLRGEYPIPDLPADLPDGLVLDIGCNWGRWSIGASNEKRQVVGMDIDFEALLIAQGLARKLTPNRMPFFVHADARRTPFAPGVFDGVFSYSVIQHFSKANAAIILGEVSRVLKSGGTAVIQMPNKAGLKARITLARRKDPEGAQFDVRYYSIDELLALFERQIGDARWSVDCFFGLNVHARDRDLVHPSKRWIVDVATVAQKISDAVQPIGRLCDSVFITATKPAHG